MQHQTMTNSWTAEKNGHLDTPCLTSLGAFLNGPKIPIYPFAAFVRPPVMGHWERIANRPPHLTAEPQLPSKIVLREFSPPRLLRSFMGRDIASNVNWHVMSTEENLNLESYPSKHSNVLNFSVPLTGCPRLPYQLDAMDNDCYTWNHKKKQWFWDFRFLTGKIL